MGIYICLRRRAYCMHLNEYNTKCNICFCMIWDSSLRKRSSHTQFNPLMSFATFLFFFSCIIFSTILPSLSPSHRCHTFVCFLCFFLLTYVIASCVYSLFLSPDWCHDSMCFPSFFFSCQVEGFKMNVIYFDLYQSKRLEDFVDGTETKSVHGKKDQGGEGGGAGASFLSFGELKCISKVNVF